MKSRTTAALMLVLVLQSFGGPPASAAPVCADKTVPVSLSSGAEPQFTIYGVLCDRTPFLKKTIQVLVSGATEGGPAYWDFPHPDYYRTAPVTFEPLRDRYSYVKYLAEAGYASFVMDRIGTGKSSHPPAEDVTIESNASVIHQVVTRLRGGQSPFSTAYDRVIGVAHSLGAAALYTESAVYSADLDGIIVEGLRRHQQPAFVEFPATFEPAQSEPRFATLPPGYLTTRPGAHAQYFFYAPNAEQAVMDHEERIKETVTTGEIRTFIPSLENTEQVRIPVLSLVGEHDTFFCSAPGCPEADQEAGFFPNAPCFESHVIAGAAHDMNLQLNNQTDVFPLMLGWFERNFGRRREPCSG